MMNRKLVYVAVAAVALTGCKHDGTSTKAKPATRASLANANPVVHPLPAARPIEALETLPLYRFTQTDLDAYLKHLYATEPDAQKRLITLARKNIDQPYDIYLLGEGPYEIYDPDPLYCLEKSDCVTYVEFTYAAALSRNWDEFFDTLMKLRYKDAHIGMVTRNHNSEADWNKNNTWLFKEVTAQVGGDRVKPFRSNWQPSKFFKKYDIGQDLPDVKLDEVYIPRDRVMEIVDKLQPGDIVQIVRQSKDGSSHWIGHFTMAVPAAGGGINLINSTTPKVEEGTPLDVIHGAGIKIMRPRSFDPNVLRLKRPTVS